MITRHRSFHLKEIAKCLEDIAFDPEIKRIGTRVSGFSRLFIKYSRDEVINEFVDFMPVDEGSGDYWLDTCIIDPGSIVYGSHPIYGDIPIKTFSLAVQKDSIIGVDPSYRKVFSDASEVYSDYLERLLRLILERRFIVTSDVFSEIKNGYRIHSKRRDETKMNHPVSHAHAEIAKSLKRVFMALSSVDDLVTDKIEIDDRVHERLEDINALDCLNVSHTDMCIIGGALTRLGSTGKKQVIATRDKELAILASRISGQIFYNGHKINYASRYYTPTRAFALEMSLNGN